MWSGNRVLAGTVVFLVGCTSGTYASDWSVAQAAPANRTPQGSAAATPPIEKFDPASAVQPGTFTYRQTEGQRVTTHRLTVNADGSAVWRVEGGQDFPRTFTPWRNLVSHGRSRFTPNHNGFLPEGTPMRVGLTWTHSYTTTGGSELIQRVRACEVTAYAPSMTIGDMTFRDVFTVKCQNQRVGRSMPLDEVMLWGPGRVNLRYTESSVSMVPRVTEIVSVGQ